MLFRLTICFLFCCSTLFAQSGSLTVKELITLYDSDIATVSATMTRKGFKESFSGDRFGDVEFYQWYHGRTSHNADAFLQRYVIPASETYNWQNDCIEYIMYSSDEFLTQKRYCESIGMELLKSGPKARTFDDHYIMDAGIVSLYQGKNYWIHFNAVTEGNKNTYKILIRKRPE